jgi:hypothetical protein
MHLNILQAVPATYGDNNVIAVRRGVILILLYSTFINS